MAGMVGMNIEEVRALSQQLNTSASEVQSIAQKLTSKLSSTTWVGNDRNAFENEWTSTHQANLTRVVQALQDAATAASRNADDQNTVSNA